MATFLIAAVVLGLGVLGLSFNIIVRKKDFPQFDVGSNEEMKKRGIRCFKDEDASLHSKLCNGDCSSCTLEDKENIL